jgi:hypothetical protein
MKRRETADLQRAELSIALAGGGRYDFIEKEERKIEKRKKGETVLTAERLV